MSLWKNKKTGELYCWIADVPDMTNNRPNEALVIYCKGHGQTNPEYWFARERKEFIVKFEPYRTSLK